MIKNFKKVIIALLAIIILISNIGYSVKAVIDTIIDETKLVSLTIIQSEKANGSNMARTLKGVEITISLVPNNIDTAAKASQYIKNNTVESYSKTTHESGTVKFEGLKQGRYLVQETNVPKNVTEKVEDFLIDLPRSNDGGTTWNYDVTVNPKNITIYGSVTLTQLNQNEEKLPGATWELQKKDNENNWQKYDYEGILTTDENGEIKVSNLEVGNYRFVRKTAPDNYIIDISDVKEFTITDGTTQQVTAIDEKLDIHKYVLLDDGNYGEDTSAFKTDTNSWKITADVADIITKMSKYKITDELQDGLYYKTGSIYIYGVKGDIDSDTHTETEISINEDRIKILRKNFEIDFDTNDLDGFDSILITYDTNFENTVKHGFFENSAKLEYTKFILENGNCNGTYIVSDDAKVHTGSVLIYKTDQSNNPLKGATFKIATSKENAQNGEFVKDINGSDITAISGENVTEGTEETSKENGYVIFDGLKYDGSTEYWIVETQSPTYEDENGEIKNYNLLDKPVKVFVTSSSHEYSENNTTVVVNKKGFVLPLTGGTISIISIVLGLSIISVMYIIRKRNKN